MFDLHCLAIILDGWRTSTNNRMRPMDWPDYLSYSATISYDSSGMQFTNVPFDITTVSRMFTEKLVTFELDMEPEIQMCLTQLDNCLQLLLPSPDNFDIPEVCHASSKPPSHMVQGDSSVEKDSANVEKDSANGEKDSADAEKDSAKKEKYSEYAEKDSAVVKKDSADAEKDSAKKEKYSEYAEKDSAVVKKDSVDVENDSSHVENDSAGKDKDEDGDFVRQHGLGSINYSIQVCVGDIQLTETEDNVDLLDTLQDSLRLVSGQFLPSTRHWLEVGHNVYIIVLFLVVPH